MAIALGQVFEPFIAQRPIGVMARGVLEHLCNADKSDALWARTAPRGGIRGRGGVRLWWL